MLPLVVCCGLTTLDIVQHVDRLPGPNEKLVADEFWFDVGGPAANAARVARALGCRVRLITALGGTPLAGIAAARLGDIEVSDIAPADHVFPVSTVLVTGDGARSIVSRNAASLVGADLPSTELVADAEVVLHDGHLIDASLGLMSASAPIHLLDGGSWKPGLQMMLSGLDIAVVSADFALPGRTPAQALADLAGYGIPRLARTRGSQPVELLVGGRGTELEVPRTRVVDSTGAGDVLHGALAAFLARGADFTAAMQRAVQVASASVTGRGVLAGLDGVCDQDAQRPVPKQ